MGPLIAVHVEPSPNDPRELAALLDSCSRALPQGACSAERDTGTATPAALASVRWLDEWQAHIDARVGSEEPALVTRDLTFSPNDARVERFRSVGLAIATIVEELEVKMAERASGAPPVAVRAAVPALVEPPVSAAKTPVPPVTVAAPPRRGAPVARYSESAEVGGLVGTGLLGAAPRGGIYLRVAHDLASSPVFVSASGSYALSVSSAAPLVGWTDVGLGGGGRFTIGSARFEVGARVLLDHTSASAPDPHTARDDTASSFIPGLAFDARFVWPERSAIALALGVDGSWLVREVRITNAGEEIARIPAYNVGAVAGFRLNF